VNLVEMEGVSFSYKGGPVLEGLDLRVGEGERVAVLGPSGCGKTTLLRLLAGFLPPAKGRILLGGREVSGPGRILAPPEERNLGVVFQDLALWPHLTVRGNLEFGLEARKVPREERDRRIGETLALLGIGEFARRKPSQLSGGQQQRVALARALVLRPDLLLMDEPLSSLDFDLRKKLRAEILRLQEELRFTLLYITHDREEAFHLAQRVLLLSKGRIAFRGTPEEARTFLGS